MDEQCALGLFREPDAIISDPQSQLTRVALQLLDVAFARLGKAVESVQHTHRVIAVDASNVGSRRHGKDDLLHAVSD